jgi:hypothetical protein
MDDEDSTSKDQVVGKPQSRTLLIVTTIVFVPVGVLCVLGAFVSLFMFDAPGSGENPFLYGAVACMFSLPVICLLSIPCSWVLHARQKHKAARCVALSPLCSIAGFVLMWLCALMV